MSKKILIVEDDRHIVALVRYILEREGFQVRVGRDGVEGLELADDFVPDLVVLDLNMPRMDGVEMCRRLRLKRPDVLIIFLTVHAERTAIARGYRAGADDYVVKPFELQDLLTRIRDLLARGRREGGPDLGLEELEV
ncbi:MAG: response regulator [Chloroflexia bacterium]|nr:response regulator [Chloroflexia bacterium]